MTGRGGGGGEHHAKGVSIKAKAEGGSHLSAYVNAKYLSRDVATLEATKNLLTKIRQWETTGTLQCYDQCHHWADELL